MTKILPGRVVWFTPCHWVKVKNRQHPAMEWVMEAMS